MSILLFTTKGDIMALNKTNQEELPFPIDGVEEEKVAEQISFDDLEFEAEYVDEDQEVKKFYTISGKESWYEPTWEKYTINDLDVGDEFEGRPEINIFENEDKTYNALRLRIMDDGEILDLYVNYPKKDFPYVTGINKGFDFYRKCFDFIYSVLRWKDETNVVDKNGEEYNRFKKVNLEMFAKFVDSMERVGIKITEGNSDSDYNSFIIYKME
jgi:hypothetical protein